MRSFIVLFLMALASPEEAPAPEIAAPEVAAPAASAALGLLEERTETVYYDVHGQTPYALASSLAARGPKHGGERYFGMTEWTLRASYGRRTEAGACRLTDVAVHLDVEISLPRWNGGPEAHPGHAEHPLRSDWDEFVEALDAHEHGHRALALEAADAVRAALVALERPTCRILWRDAEATMIAVMADYDERHRAYDLYTNHGYTQGVVWPRTSDGWYVASAAAPVPAH